MRCTSPRTVGYKADGRSLAWSPREFNKELATFQLPCGKCLDCRLDYARQWAVRCVHEAKMYGDNNAFITLTYDKAKLESPKLIYADFQKFMKKLRKLQDAPMGVFVTGEYGGPPKILPNGLVTEGYRPHWHAIIFNWRPSDGVYSYSNKRGDLVYTSATLDKIWGKGRSEFGSVTFHSAGYVARYAAKKLVHGDDGTHGFDPISKKSSKHAIGKKYLEQFWPDIFNYGHIVLPDGATCAIPRYYEKWFKENKPDEWLNYVKRVKLEKAAIAALRADAENKLHQEANAKRSAITRSTGVFKGHARSPQEARRLITKSKFQQLQDYLKL